MTDANALKEFDEVLAEMRDYFDDEREMFDTFADRIQAEIRPALELKARVDAGWMLVPREPTDAMLKAMEKQWSVGSSIDMARREYIAAITQEPT